MGLVFAFLFSSASKCHGELTVAVHLLHCWWLLPVAQSLNQYHPLHWWFLSETLPLIIRFMFDI